MIFFFWSLLTQFFPLSTTLFFISKRHCIESFRMSYSFCAKCDYWCVSWVVYSVKKKLDFHSIADAWIWCEMKWSSYFIDLISIKSYFFHHHLKYAKGFFTFYFFSHHFTIILYTHSFSTDFFFVILLTGKNEEYFAIIFLNDYYLFSCKLFFFIRFCLQFQP